MASAAASMSPNVCRVASPLAPIPDDGQLGGIGVASNHLPRVAALCRVRLSRHDGSGLRGVA